MMTPSLKEADYRCKVGRWSLRYCLPSSIFPGKQYRRQRRRSPTPAVAPGDRRSTGCGKGPGAWGGAALVFILPCMRANPGAGFRQRNGTERCNKDTTAGARCQRWEFGIPFGKCEGNLGYWRVGAREGRDRGVGVGSGTARRGLCRRGRVARAFIWMVLTPLGTRRGRFGLVRLQWLSTSVAARRVTSWSRRDGRK